MRDQLGGHPLSIGIMARYGCSVALPLEDLRRLWRVKWSAIADGPPLSLDDRGLRASFELTFEALPQEAKLVLLTLGLLPDGISAALVKGVWPKTETKIYDAVGATARPFVTRRYPGRDGRANRLRGPRFQFSPAKLDELKKTEDGPAAPT